MLAFCNPTSCSCDKLRFSEAFKISIPEIKPFVSTSIIKSPTSIDACTFFYLDKNKFIEIKKLKELIKLPQKQPHNYARISLHILGML